MHLLSGRDAARPSAIADPPPPRAGAAGLAALRIAAGAPATRAQPPPPNHRPAEPLA